MQYRSFPVATGFTPEGLARVGDYVRNEITTGKIPGAVLLIQQHGRPVLFESFGVRDVGSQRPMTAETIFRLYSMSKAITSVAAMMLVDDGMLSLDNSLSKYIPAFAEVKVAVEKRDENGRPALVTERASARSELKTCCVIPGPDLRILRRQPDTGNSMRIPACSTAISTMRCSPSASPSFRLRNSRERCGITVTPPMFSAASSRSYRDSRYFNSRKSGCSIGSA